MQRPGASPGLQRRGSRLVSFRRRHWGAYHPAVSARTFGAWLSAAAVTLGSGCSSAANPSPVRDTPSVERSGAAASVPEAPTPNPPPPDDEMIALGEAASTCPWSDSESGPSDGFDTSCAAFRAWREYRPRGRPLDEATLVEWLASGDARRRYLAKEKLWESGASYRTDPPLAAKVIEAATKERSLAVSRDLGVVVGRIDLRKTGTTDAIIALGRTHPDDVFRGALLSALLQSNPQSSEALALAREGLDHPSWVVRVRAVGALIMNAPPDIACAAALAGVRDAHQQIQQEGVRGLVGKWPWGPSRTPLCKAPYDAVLDALEARLDVAENDEWGQALERICNDPASTADDRRRAARAARAMAQRRKAFDDFRAAGRAATAVCERP